MKLSGKTLLLATALAATSTALGQDSKPSFSIFIAVPQTIKTGSSAILDITLTNTSNRAITLSTGTNSEGEMNFDIDVRDSEGKRAAPRPEAWPLSGHLGYVNLQPGEKLKVSANVGKLFDLRPGSYSVQVIRSEGADRLVLPQQRQSDLRRSEVPQTAQPQSAQPQPVAPIGTAIKSNTITVTLVP